MGDSTRIKEILMRQMEILAAATEEIAVSPYDPANPKQLEYTASIIAHLAKAYREYLQVPTKHPGGGFVEKWD